MRTFHARHVLECLHVFWETESSIPKARAQEPGSNPAIETHATRNLLNIGPHPIANGRDLIDES
jgi:hypothetical protein